MKNSSILCVCAIIFFNFGCTQKNNNIRNELQSILGTRLKINGNERAYLCGQSINFYEQTPDFTIVSYTDSTGCINCKLKLIQWGFLIEELNRDPNIDVNLLMIVQPKNENDLITFLQVNDFKHPVIIDREGMFAETHNLPTNWEYHTLLLDSENTVIAVGNPIYNPKIKKLYRKIIFDGDSTANEEPKPLIAQPSVVMLGQLSVNEEKSMITQLKNLCDTNVIINEIASSCNCTKAWIDNDTILAKQMSTLHISVTNDSIAGFFERDIDIYTQGNDNPVHIRIKGFGSTKH